MEEIYKESPSLRSKIQRLLFAPNVRLRLTLQNTSLNDNIQKELGKTLLGKDCKLPKNENDIEPEFNRYRWDLIITHGQLFKERLNHYKLKHPNVDLTSHPINSTLRILQHLLYLLGSTAAALNIIDHANKTFHFFG